MKKIALFMAFATFGLASCSSDDDKSTTPPTLNSAYLQGVWAETAPQPDVHNIRFQGNTATLTRQFSNLGEFTYEIYDNALLLTTAGGSAAPTEHSATIVNDSVMILGNFYMTGTGGRSTPVHGTITFKRLNN